MKIFIYGTLKSNHYNNYVLKKYNPNYLGKVQTLNKYPMFKTYYPFPYIQNDKGIGEYIIGELYEIDDKYIKNIDDFEGVPDLYYKEKIKIKYLKSNKIENVYIYFKTKKENLTYMKFLKEF